MIQLYIIIILVISIFISILTMFKLSNNKKENFVENYVDQDGSIKQGSNEYYLKIFDGDVPLLFMFDKISKQNTPITFGSKIIVEDSAVCNNMKSYSNINIIGNIVNGGNLTNYNTIVKNSNIQFNSGKSLNKSGNSLRWGDKILKTL